jgi:RimJ/RimL family protein N-acetyltransferase
MTIAPLLQTERLNLRGHRMADFKTLHTIWCEPAVYQFILGRPSTPEESWSRLLRYCGHWSITDYGYWVIEEKQTGGYIGEMGFADYHREIIPTLEGTPELGWALTTASHGKGFATEALSKIIAWGDSNLKHAKTACFISPENKASIRVAEKIGYREALRTTYKGDVVDIFYRQRKS